MIFDQANSNYTNSGTISDGATIAAQGFQLTNNEFGRIFGGVTFATGGSTLINQLGGALGLSQFQDISTVLVTGSGGADTVVNSGLIGGSVALDGGADSFVDHDGIIHGTLDLGSGDDTYRVEGSQSRFISGIGGDGQDRLVFAGTGQYWAGTVTGFEQLVFEEGSSFENFSGFQSITLQGPFAPNSSGVSLFNCLNPAADLTMDGQTLFLNHSSLRSVTGGDASDYVEIVFAASISEGISLAAGDDMVVLNSILEPGAPALTSPVAGGSGIDTLMLHWWSVDDRNYDLSSVQGFEVLNVNAWYVTDPSTARVSHATGFTDIDIGRNATLVLSDSILAGARVGGAQGGGLTLEAGSVIDRYGFDEDGPWDQRLDIIQGDPAQSTTIVNHGTISGDVRFYTGDDVYDGRDGSVGGTIYGNAGNDTMLGGAGREIMVGGYGADVLTGGAGNDIFKDTAAGHNGDTITDFSRGDVIVFNDASLAGFSFSLSGNVLTYTGGSMLISNASTAAMAAITAAGGGVQIFIAPPPIIISGGAPVALAGQLGFKAESLGNSSWDSSESFRDHDSLAFSHEFWRGHPDDSAEGMAGVHVGFDWSAQDIFQ